MNCGIILSFVQLFNWHILDIAVEMTHIKNKLIRHEFEMFLMYCYEFEMCLIYCIAQNVIYC